MSVECHGWRSSFGVGEFDDADISFDLYQVFRHRLAWDRKINKYVLPHFRGVSFNEPMKFGSEPLVEIKRSK